MIGFFQNRVLVSVLSVDTAVFRVEPKLGVRLYPRNMNDAPLQKRLLSVQARFPECTRPSRTEQVGVVLKRSVVQLLDKEVCGMLQVNYSATMLKSGFNMHILI